jgi:hypothetical protein
VYWADWSLFCVDSSTIGQVYQVRIDVPSSTAIARVGWSSDDDRIGGPVAGALVDFMHAGTPMRSPTDYAYTDASGEAAGTGAQNASGTALASKPDEPWTRGSGGGYAVNCNPTTLSIIKNKPRATLNFQTFGTATGQTYAVPSSHGEQSIASLSNPSFPVRFNNAANTSESFQVAGSWQPSADTWIDASSDSANLTWNNYNSNWASTSIPAKIWFSKKIGVTINYASDDRTVPLDQQPAIGWDTRSALANVELDHAVSSYAAKAHADTKSFTAANGRIDTWGLNGATGTAQATVVGPGADPIILSGTKTYTVRGESEALLVNAKLPLMSLYVGTQETDSTTFTMKYALDGVSKSMEVTKVGQSLAFRLPVEDPLNQPKKHTFKILSLTDQRTYFEMADRAPWPTMSVQRAGAYNHPPMNGILSSPK